MAEEAGRGRGRRGWSAEGAGGEPSRPDGRPCLVPTGAPAQPGQGVVHPTPATGARGDSADLPGVSRPRRQPDGLGGAGLRERAIGKGLAAVSRIAVALSVGRSCWFMDYEKNT